MTPPEAIATSREPFLKSPLGIALLVLSSTFGGSVLKDRLTTETRSSTADVRIEALRQQFDEAHVETAKRLDDIRQDMRDLKTSLDQVNRVPR